MSDQEFFSLSSQPHSLEVVDVEPDEILPDPVLVVPQFNPNDFYENLSSVLPPLTVNKLGNYLKSAVESDKESIETFLESTASLIESIGINLDDSGTEDIDNIFSSALFESIITMVAISTSSLYGSARLADVMILGNPSTELEDAAERKKDYINFFLKSVIPDYLKQGRQTLMWAITAGVAYKKVYFDEVLKRPSIKFIRPDHFIFNGLYPSHLTAPRKTQVLVLSAHELDLKIRKGRFRRRVNGSELPNSPDDQATSMLQGTLNSTRGVENETLSSEYTSQYVLYEIHTDLYIKEDIGNPTVHLPVPYIVTINAEDGFVYDIVRNFDVNDPAVTARDYFVSYSFFTSFEGPGYGLVHSAGKQAKMANALTRMIMEKSAYSNTVTGFVSASVTADQQSLKTPPPGTFEAVRSASDVRDAFLPLPFTDPSPVMREIKAELEEEIKRPGAIVTSKLSDISTNAPVGTVLATIENLYKVPFSLLETLHESFAHELSLLNKRFFEHLPSGQVFDFHISGRSSFITQADFSPLLKLVPANMPTIQNSAYRFVQAEQVLAQAKELPQLHDLRNALDHYYKVLGVPEDQVKQILLPAPTTESPFTGDPVSENFMAMSGKPIQVTASQDHPAHKVVHGAALMTPDLDPNIAAVIKAHIQSHEAWELMIKFQAATGINIDLNQPLDPQIQNQIAVQAAQVAANVTNQTPPPPPPIDPSQAAMAIEEMRNASRKLELEFKERLEEKKLTIENARLELESQKIQETAHFNREKIETERLKIVPPVSSQEVILNPVEDNQPINNEGI